MGHRHSRGDGGAAARAHAAALARAREAEAARIAKEAAKREQEARELQAKRERIVAEERARQKAAEQQAAREAQAALQRAREEAARRHAEEAKRKQEEDKRREIERQRLLAVERQRNRGRDKAARGMTRFNLCITGASGKGKSTLSNTLRRLKPKDPDAAKVGLVETTACATPYPFGEGVTLWDVAGCGTPENPTEGYVDRERLDLYDLVIVVAQARLTEDDVFLLKECRRLAVPCILVRSGFDRDLDNHMDNHGLDEPDVEAAMAEVKEGTRKNLAAASAEVATTPLFVLSGRLAHVDKYDFGAFERRILQAVSA